MTGEFNPKTRRFVDTDTDMEHAVTPAHHDRYSGFFSGVYTLDFEPPIYPDSDAAVLLQRAGAHLIRETDKEKLGPDKIKRAVIIPSYAIEFAFREREAAAYPDVIEDNLRDRAGALIEGAARPVIESHRLDHQLQ